MKTRKYLETLTPLISLAILTFGFFSLGILTLTRSNGNHVYRAMNLEHGGTILSGVSSIIIGTIFLVAAFCYWNRYLKGVNQDRPTKMPLPRSTAPTYRESRSGPARFSGDLSTMMHNVF